MSVVRNFVHGGVVVGVWSFALVAPGFVGAVLEDAQRMVRGSRSAVLSPDFDAARYVLFAVFLLGLAGAWQICRMTNRWRQRV